MARHLPEPQHLHPAAQAGPSVQDKRVHQAGDSVGQNLQIRHTDRQQLQHSGPQHLVGRRRRPISLPAQSQEV